MLCPNNHLCILLSSVLSLLGALSDWWRYLLNVGWLRRCSFKTIQWFLYFPPLGGADEASGRQTWCTPKILKCQTQTACYLKTWINSHFSLNLQIQLSFEFATLIMLQLSCKAQQYLASILTLAIDQVSCQCGILKVENAVHWLAFFTSGCLHHYFTILGQGLSQTLIQLISRIKAKTAVSSLRPKEE